MTKAVVKSVWDVCRGYVTYSRQMYTVQFTMIPVNTGDVKLGFKCTWLDPEWPARTAAIPGQGALGRGPHQRRQPPRACVYRVSGCLHHTLHPAPVGEFVHSSTVAFKTTVCHWVLSMTNVLRGCGHENEAKLLMEDKTKASDLIYKP